MFGRTHYFNTGHTADYAYFLFQQLLLLLVRYFYSHQRSSSIVDFERSH